MAFSQYQLVDRSDLVHRLNKGSAALLPTDTLPALASMPNYAEQLWELKQRPLDKPLILMGASSEELLSIVLDVAHEDACTMAARYWPGALTMILPVSGFVVDCLNPGSNRLGMRIPACNQVSNLLSLTGPLATTSANLAGSPPSVDEKEASNYFPCIPILAPVPWPKPSGLASTVISWESPGCWQLLRQGAVIPESF